MEAIAITAESMLMISVKQADRQEEELKVAGLQVASL